MQRTRNAVIIVAAGKGTRMGGNVKKQFLLLDRMPVLSRTILAFDQTSVFEKIIVVIPEADHEHCQRHVIEPYAFKTPIEMASGGSTRQASVHNGLRKIIFSKGAAEKRIVLIHDGVRPFVAKPLIKGCIQKAQHTGACIPALCITDTIKKVYASDDNKQDVVIEQTIDRSLLYGAQTPQAFDLDLLWAAFEHAEKTGFSATDDASVIEYYQHPVTVIKGSRYNIKLTTPEDLELGEWLLARNVWKS